MWNLIKKLDHFNYTKVGMITGLSLGLITIAMGIFFITANLNKQDFSAALISSLVPLMGLGAIIVEIYRWQKLKKK